MATRQSLDPAFDHPRQLPLGKRVFLWAQQAVSAGLDAFVAGPRCYFCGAAMELAQSDPFFVTGNGLTATGQNWHCIMCGEASMVPVMDTIESWEM